MKANVSQGLLHASIFNSRIKSRNTTKSERWIGYFAGPAGAIMFNAIIISYLNIYYTDVLNLGPVSNGLFLILFPIISKIFDAITNVIMGAVIDKTRSRQGKARPWILISAPLVALTGILLFIVPTSNKVIQLVWIVLSYNLYYGFAYSIYNMSHYLMVPLSTRNVRQRNQLSVFTNIANVAVTGMFIALVFTMVIYPLMRDHTSLWIPIMSAFSILAFPLIILEYYFTKERVTEENMYSRAEMTVPVKEQLKSMFHSKYWLLILAFQFLFQFVTQVTNLSGMYFFNWVLAPTYDKGANMSALVNIIGGFPLGIGMFAAWPLAKRFGKRNITLVGFALSVIGTGICLLAPSSLPIILIGKIVQSFGSIPIMYVFSALFADVLDHIEWQSNFRCDGMAASFINVIITVCFGFGTGFFNGLLALSGYVSPEVQKGMGIAIKNMSQSQSVQNAIAFSWLGLPIIAFTLLFIVTYFLDVEKYIPQAHKEILERHKAACEARGEKWLEPELRGKLEQEKIDKESMESFKMEMKEKCKKNQRLNYDKIVADYIEKEAKAKAKREEEDAKNTKKDAAYDAKLAAIKEKKAVRKASNKSKKAS